ncbi:MAG TPA: hypothetical protein PKA28_10955 [Methylomusa anaerophila]|uniref:Uncharacterized protein n=1 Tax=Methylomusa anaerophila TaxID=1930071 RepID=A0A348AJ31_9FIRM|nr:hypothetical protein [Methylomusa anaerophila]BBB91079.1 hypothetical protein MAMMFC1_01747 [Methylomusa anaerophila]HML88954.1 hypothetical protein [Methylomusa anaerophila]
MQRPRLRDNKGKEPFELYPLGQIPDNIIYEIGKWMTYHFAVGKSDITGEDWGDIFAKSIGGEHLGKPLGLADVVFEGMAWSVKSIKQPNPHKATNIRVISGRCSPDYSYGIMNPHEDVEGTGTAVLAIYNERINIAKETFEPLRTSILVRNFNSMEFLLFEHETARYNTKDFIWRAKENGNIEGFDLLSNKHKFTWQPHGSQFTILYEIPPSARRFKIRRPPVLDFEETMAQIGFDSSWVTIL